MELDHVELPDPGEGEVVLRVLAVGLCGSDIHWYEEGQIGDAELGSGLILGHEFCGVIESGLRAGELVAVDPAVPCLVCEQCQIGLCNLCAAVRFAGHTPTDGALREFLVWPERCLVPIPDEMPDEVAALLEPLGVALHAIDVARLGESMKVGIVGCGPIGLLLAWALRGVGFESIMATDLLPHRRAAAERLGARVIDAPDPDQGLLDVVFDAAGTDSALATEVEWVRLGGRVVVVGAPPGDRTSLEASPVRCKELELAWCRRMMPSDLERAAVAAAPQTNELFGLVTHRFSLAESAAALAAAAARRGVKTM